MEALSNTKAAVLDKTGTLTEGKFKVRSIVKTAGKSEDEILALAAAAEIYSTHPIAQSIVTCANEKGLSLPKLTSMQEIAGHGVKANLNGEDIYIGNEKLLALSGISVPSLPETKKSAPTSTSPKARPSSAASPFPMPSSPTPSKASKT